ALPSIPVASATKKRARRSKKRRRKPACRPTIPFASARARCSRLSSKRLGLKPSPSRPISKFEEPLHVYRRTCEPRDGSKHRRQRGGEVHGSVGMRCCRAGAGWGGARNPGGRHHGGRRED